MLWLTRIKKKQSPIYSILKETESQDSQVELGGHPHCTEQIQAVFEKAEGNRQKGVSQRVSHPYQMAKTRSMEALDLSFIFIPSGSFFMGSPEHEAGRSDEELQHEVRITRGFYVQTTPVTQKQWKAVMETNPSHFHTQGADRPVDGVSWYACQEFIRKLNATGEHRYRLPTEAEWEYACRAGMNTAFAGAGIGDPEAPSCLDEMGWFSANSRGMTQPVGKKRPNAWGLYDMHGNVCEWCQDRYGEYPEAAVADPVGASSGSLRVARGGSWLSNSESCRAASRFSFSPESKSFLIGFRLVRTQ